MKSILIIEDDASVRLVFESSFRVAGYAVDIAKDATEALQKVESKRYDVILLDLMLPGMSGMDLLRSLRDQVDLSPQTHIFVITNLSREFVDEALELGVTDYFLKTDIAPRELVTKIDEFLSKQRLPV